MKSSYPILLALVVSSALACGSAQRGEPRETDDIRTQSGPRPPVAERRAYDVTSPHGNRDDPYFWMRDDTRQSPEVLAYLAAENAYTEAMLAPTEALQEELYQEMIARLDQDDSTVPVLDHGYWYYVRYQTGKEYPIYARRKDGSDAEEIVLDVNQAAQGHDFYQVDGLVMSPNHQLVAYAEDTVGRRQFRLRVVDLRTGTTLTDTVDNIESDIAWGNDDRTLFYIEKDPQTLLGYRVKRHVLGTDAARDPLVYEEKDSSFYIGLDRTASEAYVLIHCRSTVSDEVLFIDANKPASAPQVLVPRERDHEYRADHLAGRWVILSNWKARNFRLVSAPDAKASDRSAWRELVPHSQDVFLHGFHLYDDYIVLSERSGGLRKIRVLPNDPGKEPFYIGAEEPAYTMYPQQLPETSSQVVRYTYTSLTTPFSTYELDLRTRDKKLLKREQVLGDFDPADYVTEYVHATARDGARIPISIVYRKGLARDGRAPMLQYAYGSYGYSSDPRFKSTRLSLLDRGFVYAIAHVRGGQEMGRAWYEGGKLLHKKNTFTDFVDATRFLVAERYAAPDKVFAMGGSAGGLLMGVVANIAPQDYRGIVAGVPFVDVVTTMLDESIPLTSNEWDEWGDPRKKEYYEYMLSYSPYDNVTAQEYPSMLVLTGLWDSQVQYFEPAKWVAKLRALKKDDNPLLMHVDMEAGHGGKSGRYQRYRETARDFAWIIHTLDVPDTRTRAPGDRRAP